MKQVFCPECRNWMVRPEQDEQGIWMRCVCGHRWKPKLGEWLAAMWFKAFIRGM